MEIEDRKRTRCKKCHLVQFVSRSKACVKCKEPYQKEVSPSIPALVLPAITPPANGKVFDFQFWLAFVMGEVRTRSGMSQREASAKMGAGSTRQYFSKIESRMHTPTVAQFEKVCKALGATPWYVLRMTEFLVNGE